jgi:hypothetical protein
MTRTGFLVALRAELLKRYPWAQDAMRLERFMSGVRDTITGVGNNWCKDGDAADAAWKAIGGKGKPTYKALRALPE